MDKRRLGLFLRFFKFVLPYKKQWLLLLILSNITSLLSLVTPYLTKLVIDEGINKKDLKSFILITLIGGSVFLFSEIGAGIKQFLERYIKTKINFDLNRSFFKHIQSLSFNWFSGRSAGEHIYKINNDIEAITDFITTVLPEALYVFPKSLLISAVIFYLNWKIALFSFCLFPFLYLPPYYFSRKIQRVCEDSIRNAEGVLKNLEETFSHIHLIKVFGKEIDTLRDYLKRLLLYTEISLKNTKLEVFNSFILVLANKIIIGLITFYGGYQAIKGHLSLGTLAAIMVYLYQLVGLQNQFALFFQSIGIGSISCRRISEILDEKPQVIEAEGAKSALFNRSEIVFKNVDFGYKPNGFILKNMSFKIEGRSHTAIVGPSGCGKTTLLNLLVRLYDPSDGEIIIDDHNIKDLKFSSLKDQIGFVLQEPFLWNDSVMNNIRYGREEASMEEIIQVAEISGVDEIVKDLADGYATIVGENASRLSEGQKQKIAIARALIKKPKILILDEAMASMDSASEERIISNIKNSYHDMTLIIVSHRLATVRNADLVYYFFSPEKMIIDRTKNLLENNEQFIRLFAGQDNIPIGAQKSPAFKPGMSVSEAGETPPMF